MSFKIRIYKKYIYHFLLSQTKPAKISIQTLLSPLIGYILYIGLSQVINQRQIDVPFALILLIYAHLFHHPTLHPPLPTPHGSLHQVPGLIPADPQQPGRLLYVRLLQYLYRQPLKKHRKPRMFLRPAHLHLPDTMNRTINPRDTSVKIGLKLTGIQMTPNPLRCMIIHLKKFTTLRTWPAYTFIMHYLNIYPFPLNVKFHLAHFPRFFYIQNLAIKFYNFNSFSPFVDI